MSLTTGRGPLSGRPAGWFTAPVPAGVSYVEPFRRRVRATVGEATVIDSDRVLLLHRPGHPPVYAFPGEDTATVPTEDAPAVPGYVTVDWGAVDAWFEESEQVLGHPRNPYHRIDCLRSDRRLQVAVAGVEIVDTTTTVVVHETALEPRLYVERHRVRTGALEPSATRTYCPYKGTATYWSARVGSRLVPDAAWSYENPLSESAGLGGLLSFDETRVEVRHDLPAAPDPGPLPSSVPEEGPPLR